jgi:hypothetical protein
LTVQARAEDAKPLAKQGRPTSEEVAVRTELAEPLQEHDGAGGEKPAVGRISYGSNNADYLTARIARDAPHVLEEMKAGQHASVRSAAKKAGLVKPEIRCVARLENVARAVVKQFPPDQAREICRLIERFLAGSQSYEF